MGVLIAFFTGWFMGSRGGESGYNDVMDALHELRESDEFATLVSVLRTHGGQALRQTADWLQDRESAPPQATEFLDRVRSMVTPQAGSPGGTAS